MGMTDVGQAFLLVVCAGLCTAIGSAAVFFPAIASLANRKTLAFSVGLASGVMLYVALVDIYTKSIGGFEEIHEEGQAFIYATLSFFGGCFIMLFLDWLVHRMLGGKDIDDTLMDMAKARASITQKKDDAPIEDIEDLANSMTRNAAGQVVDAIDVEKNVSENTEELYPQSNESSNLKKMGFAMALAIAIHNFPEGLVTFASYVENPAVGIALAVGIAIHNIPEGLCVSMPIYYATGRRCYAFMWGVFSGLTEPLGALIGWAVFQSSFGGNTYGIMFGIVSGMMTIISIHELLPTAYRYDPKNTITTVSFLVGAFMIALSLMLFSV